MEPGRGEQVKLVNASLGTDKVDIHLNRLVPGGPGGKLHHHTAAGQHLYRQARGGHARCRRKDLRHSRGRRGLYSGRHEHSLANRGAQTLEIFEIYAPAGNHFDFIVDE